MTRRTSGNGVLLVDDDAVSRDVLVLLLESAGYAVHAVGSGEDAIEWLRSGATVAVVLADVQMPGLSGPGLSTAVRQVAGPGTVILAISGSAAPPELAAAFDGFLLKPFGARHFAEAVAACRSHAGAAGESGSPGISSEVGKASNYAMNSHARHMVSASVPPPPLDERIFRQLRDAMPGPQLKQMYGMCLDDVRRRIGEMRSLAAGHEGEQFTRQAHAIKGGCGMLGASELYGIAAGLERAGLSAAGLDGNPGVNPLDELSSACDRLERMLGTRT